MNILKYSIFVKAADNLPRIDIFEKTRFHT